MAVGEVLENEETVPIDSIEKQHEEDKKKEQEITSAQLKFRHSCKGPPIPPRKVELKTRIEMCINEKERLDLVLESVMSKRHTDALESHMKETQVQVERQIVIDAQIRELITEISHIKSQLERLNKEENHLLRNCLSDLEHAQQLDNARKSLERRQSRLYASKTKEGILTNELQQLRGIILSMLHERTQFNLKWSQLIGELSFNKRFLIDLLERSILAFTQNYDLINRISSLNEKASGDFNSQVSEMLHMIRNVNAIEREQQFFAVKGKRREMAPLCAAEVKRREFVHANLDSRLQLYWKIIEKILRKYQLVQEGDSFSQQEKVTKLMDVVRQFSLTEDNYFTQFRYLNHMMDDLEIGSMNLFKELKVLDTLRDFNKEDETNKAIRGKELFDKLNENKSTTESELQALQTAQSQLNSYFLDIEEIMSICNCDTSLIRNMLGKNMKINSFNIKLFLSTFETKMNAMLSYIYYRDKKTKESSSMIKVRTAPAKIVNVETTIPATQCSECAEREDVNRYDETIVLPVKKQGVREHVKEKVAGNEIEYRLHTLSKCRLPRSRQLVNRRFM